MFNISNKHEEFFDYLISNAKVFHQGALIGQAAFRDLSKLDQHLEEVIQLEHKADVTSMEVIRKISVIFITPIDREDFYRLTSQMESCIDHLQGAIMRLDTYHITQPSSAASEMMDHIVEMAGELEEIFDLLKDISRNEAKLFERAERLSHHESAVDKLYRKEISRLFDGSQDLFDVIRWKDILGTLEDTADEVEDLGDIIKEVTMKYA
ncbi:DUF47 domain-containing protein [uncultured Selenomonas sp.]|uniref:DUF47 domain-containing protein n=1 Tax=uncultured Selenomonas sp. TaxID=159275 RepID=UPI0025E4460D|nr:DUF47 family protein [uncultured Selenomonas sp.]